MPIRCQCGKAIVLETTSITLFPDTHCPACNAAIWLDGDGLVRTRMLNKGWTELKSGNFTLAIIFSAIAVECELGRVFTKWKNIDEMLVRPRPWRGDQDSWARAIRSCVINLKLDRVCRFLTGENFDSFVAHQSDLAQSVRDRHPGSIGCNSHKAFFDQNVFWNADRIVNSGKADFGSSETEECFTSVLTLFYIISEMDFNRRRRIQENLKNPSIADAQSTVLSKSTLIP